MSRYLLSILLIAISATGAGKPYSSPYTAATSATQTVEVFGGSQAYYSPFTQMSHQQRQNSTFAITTMPAIQMAGNAKNHSRVGMSFSPQASFYGATLKNRRWNTVEGQQAQTDRGIQAGVSEVYAHTSAVKDLFRVERLTAITRVTTRSYIGETIGGVYTPQSKRYASPIVPPGDDDNPLGGTPQPIVPPGDDDTPLAPVGDLPAGLMCLLAVAYLLYPRKACPGTQASPPAVRS